MSQEDHRSPISKLIEDLRDGRVGRREFLRQVVAVGVSSATAYSLLGQATAQAQMATTYAVGEETTPSLPPQSQTQRQRPPGQVTTQALGEETSPPQVTTYAVGEESSPPADMTTQAIGEESNPPPMTTHAIGEEANPPPMTTQAIGEESRPPMTTFAVGEETQAGSPTTMALGEETQPRRPGGYWTPRMVPNPRPSPWRNWRRW